MTPKPGEDRDPLVVQREAVNQAKRKLTPKQREAFFAGKAPHLEYAPGSCPFEPGELVVLEAFVFSFTVNRIKLTRGKEVVSYMLRDDRAVFLHNHATASTPDYVVTSAMAMRDETGPEEVGVPADYQNVLRMNAKLKQAERQRATQPEEETAADLKRVKAELNELVRRATKMGVDPIEVIAPIVREIQQQHRQLQDAA